MDINNTRVLNENEPKYNKKIGAALLSSKDAEPGDILLKIHNPFITVVEKSALDRVCAYCFKEAKNSSLKRCSGCKMDKYCSQACQAASWKASHQKECPTFKSLPDVLPTPVRALMQVLLQHRAGYTEEPKWQQLKSHMAEQQEDRERAMEMLLQCKAAMKYANFPENLGNIAVEIISRVSLNRCSRYLSVSLTGISKMRVNAFRITLPDDTPVGLCFEPRASVANHSCIPNAVITFDGRILCMKALVHMKQDDEIFISYIDPIQRTVVRRAELKQRYFFTCECEKCTKDLSAYQLLQHQKSEASQTVELLYNFDKAKAYAGALIATTSSELVSQELKSLENIYSKVEDVLERAKDGSNPISRLRHLRTARTLLSPLATHGCYAQPPYPSLLHAIYLAYLDMGAYLAATIVLIFLHLNCDIYNYPQPHNPVRVIRLFTITQLLKVIASMSTEELQSACHQFLSEHKEKVERILGIDYISTVQAILIVTTDLVGKSHGSGTRIAAEITSELADVEEVQRLRGGYGDDLKRWQISTGVDPRGSTQARFCFDAITDLATFTPLLLDSIPR